MHLPDGRIDGDAGARVGRRQRRVERAGIDQMARMRRQHMGRVAAVLEDADAARRQAHVVLVGQAGGAHAAADPGIDDPHVADRDPGRVRPELRPPGRRSRGPSPAAASRRDPSGSSPGRRRDRSALPRYAGRNGRRRNASPPAAPAVRSAPASAARFPAAALRSRPRPRRACRFLRLRLKPTESGPKPGVKGAPVPVRRPTITNKSFLVLFFKKEQGLSLLLKKEAKTSIR